MRYKLLKLSAMTSTAIILSGCSITWGCNIGGTVGGPVNGGCKVEGTTNQAMNDFIRPINTMLAETIGYSFSDWQSTNVSEFSIRLDGAGTSIKNNRVTVTVFDGNTPLEAKTFDVQHANGVYKFSSPSSVKSWAYNYVDIGNAVDIDFDIDHTQGGQAVLSAEQNGDMKASASTYFTPPKEDDGSWMIE